MNKSIIILVLLSTFIYSCKSSKIKSSQKKFKYGKYDLSKNPDSTAFNLSGYIYTNDSLPTSGYFSFENNFPVARMKTSKGYESIEIMQSSPIHNADENGYFSFNFDNQKDIIINFSLFYSVTIKPEIGKKIEVIIYLDKFK